MTSARPSISDLDLFSDESLTDPYPIYRQLRDKGAAVWIEPISCWALPRYDDVRSALRDWETYSSAQGVGINDDINQLSSGTVLASDPPLHDVLRSVLAERLSPRALRSLSASICAQADALVGALVDLGTFDAVADLARVFPPTIIADLVGLPHEIRPYLLDWGDAVFNTLGPLNERAVDVMPVVGDQFQWLYSLDGTELVEGSMGRAIFDAAAAGVISRESAPQLLSAYTSASMDTTVNAIGSAVALFAQNPEQWAALRADRSLISAAFNEVLRFESPLQMFTRVATRDLGLGGNHIASGDRLIMMYGSANRDERHFGETADLFDITRDASDHLAFGSGLHACAGQGLARLEAHSVFNALADRVVSFTIEAAPVRHLNNTVRGLRSLEVSVKPA